MFSIEKKKIICPRDIFPFEMSISKLKTIIGRVHFGKKFWRTIFYFLYQNDILYDNR